VPRKESRILYSKKEIEDILQRKYPDNKITGIVMDKDTVSVEFKNET